MAAATVAGSAQARWRVPLREKYMMKARGRDSLNAADYKMSELEEEFLREFYLRYDPESRAANHYAYHRQWWMNMAYFLGLHWLKFSESSGKLEERATPPWRRLYTANRIFTAVLRTQSKLLADNGIARMLPKTTERKDILAAKNAEVLCEHLQDLIGYDEIRAEIGLWSLICGTGFSKFWWNPNAGESVQVQTPGGGKTSLMTGDMDSDACSPFSVRIPPFVTKMKFMPWLVHVTTRPLEYVYANWPDKAKYVCPDTAPGWENWIEERMHSIIGPAGTSSPAAGETYPGMVKIYSLYARPTEKHQNGIHGIMAGGIPMQVDEKSGGYLANNYAELGCPIPFQEYRFARAPGRFWGASLVEQMIHPQREYNIARSQIIENKDLMSRPKWLLPKGHGIPKHGITGAPGECIEYNPSLPKPEQLDVKPLPNYVIDHIDRCVQELQDVSAQQDVTQAKAPASIRSGVAIQLLQGADNAVLAGVKQGLMFSDRESYRIMLKIASKMYTEPRLITVLGRDSIIESYSLSGADLRGHTAIRVTAESGMMDTKASRQQTILDYVQLGILNPQDPDEKIAILKSLEIGDVRSFVRDRLLDERMAEYENATMADLEKPGQFEARDFEDHQVHIQRHNALRKSVEYKMLPKPQQKAIDMHVAMHQQFLAQQMQAQMQMLDAKKGTPGEKGKPSPTGSGPSGQAAGGDSRPDQKAPGASKEAA